MAASDLDGLDESDGSQRSNKIIKSAFDSDSFDSDGIIHAGGLKGSATISPCGRDVAVASPEGLAIIDLDNPYSAPRMLKSHGMPWLVVDVQWSPFAARDYWVASTANHRCLVWNLNRADDSSAGSVEHSLTGHRRSITDVNFSAHHPDMLATCSVDGYVHCWDLRRANTPALTFIDWAAGATQVKYNRQDEHVLASSHNRCVHIWDDRNPAIPMRTIEAHTSKIYGLDWNRTRSTCLVTCSLDKTIKFWDYAKRGHAAVGGTRTSLSTLSTLSDLVDLSASGSMGSGGPINDDDVPERVIRTHFPVWRARHTPFSGGLLAMPQNAPGHLYLYDARPTAAQQQTEDPAAANEPVAVFGGHGHHKVKEFLWRTRGEIDNDGSDNREYQLVSWGNDSKLRLRRFDGPDLATVGFHRGQPAPKNLSITRKGAAYKTFRVLEDLGDYEKRSATMSSVRPYSRREASAAVAAAVAAAATATTTTATVTTMAGAASSPPPRALLPRTSSMRDVLASPAATPRRGKYDKRASWRNPSMRATKASGRRERDRSNAQLDWMKGVTMSKRRWDDVMDEGHRRRASNERMEDSTTMTAMSGMSVMSGLTGTGTGTATASLSSPLQLSAHGTSLSGGGDYYGGPETIQEEIVRITDKLPRVTWEEIDMDNLSLTAAMKGPWGAEGQSVYVKVRVVVPATYPQTRAPRFYVENSSLMPAATQDRVAAELHVIGAEFLKRRRNCLLAAFRYLLGAADLGASLAVLERPTVASWLAGEGAGGGSGGGGIGGGEGGGGSGEVGIGAKGDDSSSSSSSSGSDGSDSDIDSAMAAADAEAAAAAGIGPEMQPQGPPPPPRSCGARFSRDGRLVCFFLTKAGRASAKLLFEPPPPPTSEELAELEKPVFIGFGRVLTTGAGSGHRGRRRYKNNNNSNHSPGHNQSGRARSPSPLSLSSSPLSSRSDGSDSDSAYSSTSSSSSSSSSSSETAGKHGSSAYQQSVRNMVDPWSMNMGFQRRIVRRGGGGRAARRRMLLLGGGGSSDGEGGGVGGGGSGNNIGDGGSDLMMRSGTLDADLELPQGPKSTVSVVDMRSWLPSKRELAREYAVFGDGAEVCAHNAGVADKYGETDLGHVWRYAALLLKSDVPLRLATMLADGGRRQRSVLVIAREATAAAAAAAVATTGRSRTGEKQAGRTGDRLAGRVKWGLHPLARDFVDDLFEHFEQRADMQMLAMLSCIFGESFEEDSVAYAESHMSQPDTPLPMKAPSFSLDYVPTTRGLVHGAPSWQLLPAGSGHGISHTSSSSNTAPPTAVFYDGSIDPDDGSGGSGGGGGGGGGMGEYDVDDDGFGDYDDVDGYDDDDFGYGDDNTTVWEDAATAAASATVFSHNNSYSGGETPPKWGDTNSNGLSSSPRFSLAASRFFRRGNNAVVSAIAASIPQTLTTLLSSSPQDRAGSAEANTGSHTHTHTHTATTIPTRRMSSAAMQPRLSPPAGRHPLPYAVQPLSHAYKQLLLHSTSAHRDIPIPSPANGRRLAASTSTSPRTGSGGGKTGSKLLSSSPLSSQDHAGPARKRPSPAETIFGNLTSGNLTWAASALFGGGSGGSGEGRGCVTVGGPSDPGTAATSVSDDGRRREDTLAAAAASAAVKGARAQAEAAGTTLVAVDIHVRTCNDHLFDDDGWMVASLLGSPRRRRRQYAEYRYAYSELLQVWGEPLARLEVLKFNVLREDAMKAVGRPAMASGSGGTASPSSSRRSRLQAVRDSGRGLDAVGVCPQCEMQLEPAEYESTATGSTATESTATATATATAKTHRHAAKNGGAVGSCQRCRLTRAQLRCVYCTEPVDALYLPCFGCGCASHPTCLRAWYAAGERFCPAGDECACAEEATSGRVESWTAMQAELAWGGGAGGGGGLHSISVLGPSAPVSTHKAKGLIEQARQSAHYAASSSSASLLSPYGQHAGGAGRSSRLPPSGLQQQLYSRRQQQEEQERQQRFPPWDERPQQQQQQQPQSQPQPQPQPQPARFSLSSRLLRGPTLLRQSSGNQHDQHDGNRQGG